MTDQTLAEELEALASVSATGNLMIPAGPNCIDRANTQLLQTVRNNLPAILSALREREVLREALEPFAKVADMYDDREDDTFEVWIDAGPLKVNNVGQSFRLANYRAARAALQGGAS